MNERKFYRVLGKIPALVEYTVLFHDGETRDDGRWDLIATPPGRNCEASDYELNLHYFTTPMEAVNAELPLVKRQMESAENAVFEAVAYRDALRAALNELEQVARGVRH